VAKIQGKNPLKSFAEKQELDIELRLISPYSFIL
jgi:hypothetical protein